MYTAILKVSGRLHPLSLQCQIDGRCAYLSIVNLSVAANRMLHPVSDEPLLPPPPWLLPVAHFDRYAPQTNQYPSTQYHPYKPSAVVVVPLSGLSTCSFCFGAVACIDRG